MLSCKHILALLAFHNTLTTDQFCWTPWSSPKAPNSSFGNGNGYPLLNFFFEPLVVNTEPKTPIRFRDKQDWCAAWEVWRSDEVMLKHILNLLLCFVQLQRAHLIQRFVDWGYIIVQVNPEFMTLVHWWKSLWEVLRRYIIKFLQDCTNQLWKCLLPFWLLHHWGLPLCFHNLVVLHDYLDKPQESSKDLFLSEDIIDGACANQTAWWYRSFCCYLASGNEIHWPSCLTTTAIWVQSIWEFSFASYGIPRIISLLVHLREYPGIHSASVHTTMRYD